jgi:hypothetical protein
MIFDIVGSTIVLKAESLVVPEFRKLWDRDKSKDKKRAINEITYAVFLCDKSDKNPYKNYSEFDRIVMLKKDFDIKEIDSLIQEAVEKYKKLNTTRYERVVHAALDSLEDIEDYYIGIKEKDKKEFDISEYLGSMEKLGKAIKSLRELEKQLEADRTEGSKVRGDNQIGLYEIPK